MSTNACFVHIMGAIALMICITYYRGMPILTEYASWGGHSNFAVHAKTVGSSVHSFSTTAGYETAELNLEKQSNLAEKA